MTIRVFLFGPLLDDELRTAVAGRSLPGKVHVLAGIAATLQPDGTSLLLPSEGQKTNGLIVEATDDVKRRLDFWMSAAPAERDGLLVYLSNDGQSVGEAWSLLTWQKRHGPLMRLAAAEYMALIDTHDKADAARAMPQIRMRAASQLRATAHPSPTTLAPVMTAGADSLDTRHPYTDYFAVREDDLCFPLFSGGMSSVVKRASFLGGDAVTVLPYDPENNSVLLVRQFRHGPFARGDKNPWTLEPAAGRIDPGEDPEETARRELLEETGVTATGIHFVGRYYPSPGAYSEYLYSYVALADLSRQDQSVGGLKDEAEDIMSHVLPLDQASAMIATGEINTGPLILSLQWLALNKTGLRAFISS